MPEFLSPTDLLHLLAVECQAAGGQAAWGRKHGITPQQVNDTLRGRLPIGPVVANALGTVAVEHYVMVKPVRSPAVAVDAAQASPT